MSHAAPGWYYGQKHRSLLIKSTPILSDLAVELATPPFSKLCPTKILLSCQNCGSKITLLQDKTEKMLMKLELVLNLHDPVHSCCPYCRNRPKNMQNDWQAESIKKKKKKTLDFDCLNNESVVCDIYQAMG